MEVRVFVNAEDMATFTCPGCKTVKTVNVSKHIKHKSKVKINCKCKCGYKYPAFLERRRYYRKVTNLKGTYFLINNKDEKGDMTVKDISRSGIGFETFTSPLCKVNEKVCLEFVLDNDNRTLIKKKAVVVELRGKKVGLKFLSLDHYDELGPYFLM